MTMTRSAFYDARLAHWKAQGHVRMGEDLDPERQALRDVEAAEASGKEWDPEEPELPFAIIATEDEPSGIQIWEAVSVDEAPKVRGRYLGRFEDRATGYAAIAAYNRERQTLTFHFKYEVRPEKQGATEDANAEERREEVRYWPEESWTEAARRWKPEPEMSEARHLQGPHLRERIEKAVALMETHWPVVTTRSLADALAGILTGKES